MSKKHKKPNPSLYEGEENTRHQFRVKKKMQNQKMLKNLDRALRAKDYNKLATIDDF